MSRVKKQHYVPQTYLRRFSPDGEHIWAFDKARMESWRPRTLDVAMEKFFYDLPVEEDEHGQFGPQVIETMLSQIEGQFAAVLERVIQDTPERGLQRQDKNDLAPFIGLQLIRSRDYRQRIIETGKAIDKIRLEWGERLALAHGQDPDVVQWADGAGSVRNPKLYDPATASTEHAMMIVREVKGNELATDVHKHIWVLGVNDTEMPLYTSDQPIATLPHIHHRNYSYSGIRSRGVELAYPLTPRLILLMFEREYHQQRAGALENRAVPLDLKMVWYYNRAQVVQSNRQVYCDTDEFVFAREVCEQSPGVREPNRPLIRAK